MKSRLKRDASMRELEFEMVNSLLADWKRLGWKPFLREKFANSLHEKKYTYVYLFFDMKWRRDDGSRLSAGFFDARAPI